VVTAAARREAVFLLRERHEVSERRACKVIGADRTMIRYRHRRAGDPAVRVRLRELAGERRRFGYRRLGLLLAREEVSMNHKKLRRLYREERLQVRRRGGRKRAVGTRAPLTLPQAANQRWSLDFAFDTMADGRRFRILCVVDDFSRACLTLVADTSLCGQRVARELDAIADGRGLPQTIVSDNGTELTSVAMLRWSQERNVAWHYIAPGHRVHLAPPCPRCACGMATQLQRGSAAFRAAGTNAGLDQAAAALVWSRPLGVGSADGLRPAMTQAARERPEHRRPGRRNGARPNRETPSRSA
jgi:transposase InsO family protein